MPLAKSALSEVSAPLLSIVDKVGSWTVKVIRKIQHTVVCYFLRMVATLINSNLLYMGTLVLVNYFWNGCV